MKKHSYTRMKRLVKASVSSTSHVNLEYFLLRSSCRAVADAAPLLMNAKTRLRITASVRSAVNYGQVRYGAVYTLDFRVYSTVKRISSISKISRNSLNKDIDAYPI